MWKKFISEIDATCQFFDPATEIQVSKVEQALGVVLPASLRSLLFETNGIEGDYDLVVIWSIEQIFEENKSYRTDTICQRIYMPFDNLLFFGIVGNGDLFCFPIIQGQCREEVFYWDHENDSRYKHQWNLQEHLQTWLTSQKGN